MSTLLSTPRGKPTPISVYLASLAPAGRRSMAQGLRICLRLTGHDEALALDDFPWADLRYEHLVALRATLIEQGYAVATINLYLAALKGVLKTCWRMGTLDFADYSRAVDVRPVPGSQIPPGRRISAQECGKLFAAADARISALLTVGIYCGARSAEIVGLDVGDWDERHLLLKGKGGKERRLPVPARAAEKLNIWMRVLAHDTGPFFPRLDRSGESTFNRLTPSAIQQILLPVIARADIPAFAPHDMRRTFISNLLESGVDLATAQRLAGHGSPITTSKYDRRGETALETAMDLHDVEAKDVETTK